MGPDDPVAPAQDPAACILNAQGDSAQHLDVLTACAGSLPPHTITAMTQLANHVPSVKNGPKHAKHAKHAKTRKNTQNTQNTQKRAKTRGQTDELMGVRVGAYHSGDLQNYST